MTNSHRRYSPALRTAAVGAGAATVGVAALLVGEVRIAKRSIGVSDLRPPSADGVYGDDLPGQPVRCLILGDSAAVAAHLRGMRVAATFVAGRPTHLAL